MTIQCECGKFQAKLTHFPKNSPGRLACYCDDCQVYAHHLGRADLLDSAGGTEVVPVYPSEFQFAAGLENLQCLRLSDKGVYRWYTACCNTPIANTQPGFPWVGVFHRVYNVQDAKYLEKTVGQIRARIHGRFARGTPPAGTPKKMNLQSYISVMPFLLKGFFQKKAQKSPFFQADGLTPIKDPKVLTAEERNQVRQRLGF
jgi:hypothetical protein